MIYLKTADEILLMQEAATLVSRTLGEVAKWVAPGVTTAKLDTIAREFMHDNGGRPACLGYHGFPGTLCIEVNDTVVHGFPSDYVLRDGDIVGIDTVAELNGYNGDSAYTFAVGDVDPKVLAFLRDSKESLARGVEAAVEGARIGNVSNAVQTYCERRGYNVIRDYTGHGIGRSMHEAPEVPNFGRRGIGPLLKAGMCICIEPMVSMGSKNVVIAADGWQARTKDHSLAAHYEHTLAILHGETRVLTTFDYIRQALGDRFI